MGKVIRKPNRLHHYDYSSCGVYFITVCAKDRQSIFGQVIVGPSIARLPTVGLTACGRAVEQAIMGIEEHYPTVRVEHYVIMPNHLHLLLRLEAPESRAVHGPTVAVVIQQMKGYATKLAGCVLWQSRYYDHVVRDQADYDRILQYMQYNPARWTEDEYFV